MYFPHGNKKRETFLRSFSNPPYRPCFCTHCGGPLREASTDPSDWRQLDVTYLYCLRCDQLAWKFASPRREALLIQLLCRFN